MYEQTVGNTGTVLLQPYSAGIDTIIVALDDSVIPTAPNAITITSLDGSKLVTVEYASKSGATLSGLTVVEGNTTAALTATYPAGSTVSRPLCKMDIDAIQDNIRDLDECKAGLETSSSQSNGLMSASDKRKLDGVEAQATSDPVYVDAIIERGNDLPLANLSSGSIILQYTNGWGIYYLSIGESTASVVKHGNAEPGKLYVAPNDGSGNGIVAYCVDTHTLKVIAREKDITKLDGIATGAQVNKLEGVQLAGTDLAISGKKVNIPLGTKTQAGVFRAGLGLEVTNGTLNLENPLMQTMHGIKVDWGNTNPATNIKYSLLSTLRTPASPGVAGDWDASWLFDDDQRYYVVLHNIASATAAGDVSLAGTEHYRLDPDNIFKKKNGETAVLDGTDGDVMVCRKLMWDKYLKGTGTEDEIILSKGRPEGDPGWYARAFEYEGTIRDRVYYGVCHAYKDANNRLRSIIDYTNNIKPTANTTITNFETYATNNGEGYSQWNVNLHDMMQMLFWFKYRNMNSQTALGNGYVDTAETDPRPDICGGSFRAYTEADPYSFGGNPGGYDYGLTTGNNAAGTTYKKVHIRFDGMDDYFGNVVQWCKGVTVKNLTVDGVTQYWVERAGGNAESPNFNNWDASKVRRVPTAGITENKWGYISAVSRMQEAPLQPVALAGASNKLVCDYGTLYSGSVAASGGYWTNGTYAGVSRLYVYSGLSGTYANIGARLVYYPPEVADI